MPEPSIIGDVPIAAAWNLQGDVSRDAFASEVHARFGVALPTAPNSTARSGRLTTLWLGPRSWLLVAHDHGSPLRDYAAARDALNATGAALFDVSASRVAFRVHGPHASAVLAGGCPLDFDARVFPAGSCAQSLFVRVNALIHKLDESPTFVVMVARSFARDVRRHLDDLAAECR